QMDEIEKEKYSTYIERDIVSHTSQVLHGIEITETWFDPGEKTYYALAVLSRQKTAMHLKHEIEVRDNTTAIYLSVPHGTDDKLLEVAMVKKAIEAQWERVNLQHSFSIIDLFSPGIPPNWDVRGMETAYHKLLGEISFQVKGSKDLKKIITSSLTSAGFVVNNNKSADYQLFHTLKLGEIKRDGGRYWLQGDLTLRLKDPDGQLRGSHTWTFKQSATQKAIVKQRINVAIEQRLKEELRPTLLSFAYDR
ncbi:MAG: hypothetical protein KAJ19_08235, partial [Gammaproteobacteria bacterium]|nr:hypothetical protein [Gammaproteobacteria bacterium]